MRKLSLLLLVALVTPAPADVLTTNFVVHAPGLDEGRYAKLAEEYRKKISVEWFGSDTPTWEVRYGVSIERSNLVVGGYTENRKWGFSADYIYVLASPDRADTSLSHEIAHAIQAARFKSAPPRWCREGMSMVCETPEEQKLYDGFLPPHRVVPLVRLFATTEYPKDRDECLAYYSQSMSVTKFLVSKRDRKTYTDFVASVIELGTERQALAKHYKIETVAQLETEWLNWRSKQK